MSTSRMKACEDLTFTDGDKAIIKSHSKVRLALAQCAQGRNIGPFLIRMWPNETILRKI